MSRTDKTNPWKVAKARGECDGACHGRYPCRHFSSSDELKILKRRANRRSRTKLRTDLARGVEPSTDQHRHGALWDLY